MLAAFDWHTFWDRIFGVDGAFAPALFATIYIAVIAQVLGVVLGLLLGAHAHVAPARVARCSPGFYVWIFRGTPVIVQIFFVYFGVNILFGVTLIPNSLDLGAFTLGGAAFAGILALGFNEGAYMREIIRAGIDSVDKGQLEAARSLGMTHGLAMRRIVLPQAARVIVPPLGNEFNNMLKTTSLLFFIGVVELWGNAEIGYSQTFKPVEYFAAVAVWYLLLTTIWTFIQSRIERRLAVSERDESALTLGERLRDAFSHELPGAGVTELVVRAVDVHKRFGRLEVLKGVSLDVAKRRDVCIIGPSGSGKTTYIRCVNHLEKIDGGPDRGQRPADRLPREQREARRGQRALDREAAHPDRDGVPALQPVPAQDRARERDRGAGARPRRPEEAGGRRGAPSCCAASGCSGSATPTRGSSRAASSSASRSRERSR